MTKSDIRFKVKTLKENLSAEQINTDSNRIINKFLQLPEYKQCSQLICYVSFNQEVKTTKLIEAAFADKKKVAVPKVEGNKMNFYYIHSIGELERSNLNIYEPEAKNKVILETKSKNLIVVPGLAFDHFGNRIGYGKGFYDNYFLNHSNVAWFKIAYAYDFQVFEKLPVENHDIQIDKIITPTLIKITSN